MSTDTRRRVVRLAAVATTVLLGVAAAVAYPIILLGFESQYPTTTIPEYTASVTGDQCLTCHVAADRSVAGNAYRIALVNALLDYNAIDMDDSDGDGVANGVEAETARVDPPLDVAGTPQVGYNPGLIDCPNGLMGYDPLTMRPVSGVHETPPGGIVWTNEVPGTNCADGLDNDCDFLADAQDPDCDVECEFDVDCDDGVFCNGVETCDAGQCVDGTTPACDDGLVCTADSCDTRTDTCANDPVPDDTPCEDGVFCNGAETCQSGVCSAGSPPDCSDGDDCTVDVCDTDLDQCVQSEPPLPGEGAFVGFQIVTPGQPDVAVSWQSLADAEDYNLYVDTAGDLSGLACSEAAVAGTGTSDATPVATGDLALFLVTGANCAGEGTLGADSAGVDRTAAAVCP